MLTGEENFAVYLLCRVTFKCVKQRHVLRGGSSNDDYLQNEETFRKLLS